MLNGAPPRCTVRAGVTAVPPSENDTSAPSSDSGATTITRSGFPATGAGGAIQSCGPLPFPLASPSGQAGAPARAQAPVAQSETATEKTPAKRGGQRTSASIQQRRYAGGIRARAARGAEGRRGFEWSAT